MPGQIDQREAIVTALKALESPRLADAARQLFATLGYESDRRIAIATPKQFREQLDPHGKLNAREGDTLDQVNSLHFLFQLTNSEFEAHVDMFHDSKTVQATKIESYLFFAVELPNGQYTRSALSNLVRAVNKPLPMPALVLFRHGDTTSLGIIHRRLHKRDQSRDVLDKVTLIKDIAFADPIRAHIEILNDFVLDNLDADFGISNFVRLHEAWQKRLGSYALSNDFYREIADWYFWAQHQVEGGAIRLPQHCNTEQEKSLFLIRLLTRVIFCWFLVEKRLIPVDLFREYRLKILLKEFNPGKDPRKTDIASTYYHAILQNLFFGTLNMPPEQRAFRERKKAGERYDKNHGITNLWRYETDLRDPAEWSALASRVPFLNGGLFDCLDDKIGTKTDNFILDGFSDNPKLTCHLPNDLFFGPERTVDLSGDYGEEDKRTARSKNAKVRGLIDILSRYKFTIEENTPLEEEIALDPELLGKVFENLLASFNEETRTTARKALGAFYTPREIVHYMVDEALKSYLGSQVPRCKGALEDLFSNKATLRDIRPDTRDALIAAIGRVKILDPACGSGAFPMGALHRLVDLLQKLDPNNESWKRDRLAEARRYRKILEEAGAAEEEIAACDVRIADIEKSFDSRFHALDFARKLYLVEDCIYGVDIQPIATQIAKLRFFISLVVDQKVNAKAPNLGVRPLPNLETRLVAADTLIPIDKEESDLFSGKIDKLRGELAAIRHEHFNARTPAAKRKWREADDAKRHELAELLEDGHFLSHDSARKLAGWDPYDQNASATFFDPEWMFNLLVGKVHIDTKSTITLLGNLALVNDAGGQSELIASTPKEIDSGFDVIISNPPYRKERESKELFDKVAVTSWGAAYREGKMDYWFFFMHRSIDLIRRGGTIAYITSRYWIESAGAQKLIGRLAAELTPLVIVDIGKLQVFNNVAGHHMIHIYRRSRENLSIVVKRLSDDLSGLLATKSGGSVEVFSRLSSELFKETGRVRLYASKLDISTKHRLGDRFRVSQGVVQNPDKVNRKNAERFGLHQRDGVFVLTPDEVATLAPSAAERKFIKPFYDESDIRRFSAKSPSAYLLYLTKKNCPSLKSLPNLRRHLLKFRPIMEERRETRNGTIEWFHLHWPRDAVLFEENHLVFPSMFTIPTAALFTEPAYVGIGSNVVVSNGEKADLGVLACLLNSPVSAFWWHENAKQRGAGYDVGVDRLRDFPLPDVCPSGIQLASMHNLGKFIGSLAQKADTASATANARDSLMSAYWERMLNGLVYELYFPEDVHGAGLRLFDLVGQAGITNFDAIPEPNRLRELRQLFEPLYDGAHPLRIALDKLQTLDTVRIIEGKA